VSNQEERAKLTYAFDAYCGWCYGFSPALHGFVTANSERLEFQVLSGGLFKGARALPLSAYPHIPEANRRIVEVTGVHFGHAYERRLADATTVMDSTDAAVGLVALRAQPGVDVVAAITAMQEAWYLHGRSLSDPRVYRDIASALGLDPKAVAAAFADPLSRIEAIADFREVHRLGVESYPTLLLHTPNGSVPIGGPLASAAELTHEFAAEMVT
jgi:putative protein-disulfide isomerase